MTNNDEHWARAGRGPTHLALARRPALETGRNDRAVMRRTVPTAPSGAPNGQRAESIVRRAIAKRSRRRD